MATLTIIGGVLSVLLLGYLRLRAALPGEAAVTANAIVQFVLYSSLLVALGVPLGAYMARVYAGEARFAQRVLGPVERLLYRLAGVDADEEMSWKRYAVARARSSTCSASLARLRAAAAAGHAAAQPARARPRCRREVAFNTAVSFATQHELAGVRRRDDDEPPHADAGADRAELRVGGDRHGGAGRADPRLHARSTADGIGNFWVDLTRSTLYILLPLSIVLALVLVSQGVVQTFAATRDGDAARSDDDADGNERAEQMLALGPVASQVAIKQLGTNGGGFFNVNSAHPFENPTPLSNFLEVLAILLIPAALCFTFGAHGEGQAPGLGACSRRCS